MGVMNSGFEEPIKRILGVPKDLSVLCTVSVGYPDEKPTSSRKPLGEKSHWDRYGAKKPIS